MAVRLLLLSLIAGLGWAGPGVTATAAAGPAGPGLTAAVGKPAAPLRAEVRARAGGRPLADAGGEHSCAVRENGTLWCWGRNVWGQVGNGLRGPGPASPMQVGTDDRWRTVSAGGATTCAIRAAGTLWCWGLNHRGQLGQGDEDVRIVPTRVGSRDDWRQVSVGWFTTCGVRADGTAWCWGDNSGGQLGDGSTKSSYRPKRVTGTGWRQLSVTGWHVCGVREDGSLWCWGRNLFGQVGDGSWRDRSVPVRVGAASGWRRVEVSWTHTCAQRRGGGVRCWGRNSNGQLGDGTVLNRNRPVATDTAAAARSVSVAEGTSCLTGEDLTLRCWGSNSYGLLGASAPADSLGPVATDDALRAVRGGWMHMCGKTDEAAVACWGNNERGQLGDGTLTDRSDPTEPTWPANSRSRSRGGPYEFTLATVNVLGHNHTRPYAHEDRFAPSRIRAEWLAQALRNLDVDVVGLQETTASQLSDILRSTRGQWAAFPRPAAGDGNVETTLLWRKRVWEATRLTTIRTQFISRELPRPVVRLRHRATGRQLWVMNVHNAPWDYQRKRNQATRKQIARIVELRESGLPVFYIGDLNEKATILCKVLRRTDLISPLGGRLKDGECILPEARMRVDWIFGPKPGVEYSRYLADRPPLMRISTDHWVPRVRVRVP